MSSYAHVVHTTAKQVISRRRKNENVFKMSKDQKCTCKACKNTVFHCQICKFVGFLLPSSSWLLKLSIPSCHERISKMLILVHARPKSSVSDAFYSFKTLGSFSAKFLVSKSLYLTVNCKERRLGKFVIKLSFMERNLKFWKIVNHSWQAT